MKKPTGHVPVSSHTGRKISMAVVRRLPRYFRYLSDILKAGETRISSLELSRRMNVTASQIRQDLNCFGGFGQQGYGYNVEHLFREISRILGLEQHYRTIIIGAGNIGHALANYTHFRSRGYTNIGIFDVSPDVVGTVINGLTVRPMKELDAFTRENRVDIAILSVPYDQTRLVADKAASLGIRALWNFSPTDLKLEQDVFVENVHLSDSLMVLGYRLASERLRNEQEQPSSPKLG